MPTAAKLVAAASFAMFSWLCVHLYATGVTDAPSIDRAGIVCAILGAFLGWWIMGNGAARARSMIEAMGTGLRTAVTIFLFALLIFGCAAMLERAMKGRYRDPMQALLSVFDQAMILGKQALVPDLLAVILLGGLLSGALSYWAWRLWR